jgi:hypothetical protein
MSKRADQFERLPQDAYQTPAEAAAVLLWRLKPRTRFIEPCCGEGRLVGHLIGAGHLCVSAHDLPVDARSHQYDIDGVDRFITNPPWRRDVMHDIIINLSDQLPTWLLIDADWLATLQAAPYLCRLRDIAMIGRVRWIDGTDNDGKDNCCWCLFWRPKAKPVVRLTGKMAKAELQLPPFARAA